jgi:hypothetical protein
MTKYLLKLSLVLLLFLNGATCVEDDNRPPGRRRTAKADLPKKGARMFAIIPAGAQAVYVSLEEFAEIELRSGLTTDGIGSVLTLAGGVSSGALAAAGLTITAGGPQDKPLFTAAALKQKIISERLVAKVFPETTDLMDELHNVLGFTLDELETIFMEIMSVQQKPTLDTDAEAQDFLLKKVLPAAALKKPSILGKIGAVKGNANVVTLIKGLANKGDVRRDALKQVIVDVLPTATTIGARDISRVIAIASHNQTPVFFASSTIGSIPNPRAVDATELWKALVSSAAIPGFIESPNDIVFLPSNAVISALDDGFFAKGVGFDPSGVYYDIFTKEYPKDDIFIIYLGNGAPVNRDFRKKHRLNKDGVFQVKENGRTITYVAIDAKIVDDNDNSLFNISQFYDNAEVQRHMQQAANEATKKGNKAFEWAVTATKAAIGVK